MRDVFGHNFSSSKEESKDTIVDEDTKIKGIIHISTNGYYGYQLIQTNNKPTNDNFETMDVQYHNDSDIQFNNFINPEDRLCSDPLANMRETVNRKRRLNYDITTDSKKRRENEPDPELHRTYKCLSSRPPTHNVPDLPRNLMGHFI